MIMADAEDIRNPVAAEEEPLLGPPGSVQQGTSTPIYHNFLTGAS
jgi:hypothetical protein